MPSYVKDPDAVLDYGFDWSDWLQTNETIVASSWTVDTGLTKTDSSYSNTATTVWLSGGTAGEEYKAVNHIVTSDSREDDRTITIKVRQR